MDTYQKDLWKHLERVSQLEPESGDAVLSYLLELACQSQHTGNIERGRKALLRLPRDWVLQHIERVAEPLLQLNDEWEYRRLLEVYEHLDKELVQKLVYRGLTSQNPEIRETAADYRESLATERHDHIPISRTRENKDLTDDMTLCKMDEEK
jgi:hypothetical protein